MFVVSDIWQGQLHFALLMHSGDLHTETQRKEAGDVRPTPGDARPRLAVRAQAWRRTSAGAAEMIQGVSEKQALSS